jgi:methyl-accepting chemotaxis protein
MTRITSNLQVQVAAMICLILLTVLGVGTIVGVNEIKRNYIEAVKWRSEALAQSLVSTLHHRALLSADDRDVSREFSTECRQLFELYKTQRVTHIAIIDTAGTIIAHNDQRAKDRPISPVLREAAKISETTIILDQGIYHTFVPINTLKHERLNLIDIGFSEQVVQEKIRRVLFTLWVFVLLPLLSGAGFIWLSRSMLQPIQEIMQTTERISTGDLTNIMIPEQGRGEIRRLTCSFRIMARNLYMITQQVQRAGDLMKNATHEILAATDQLAAALEEQSASVLQTSTTMESVVAASQQISQSTDAVVQIAQKTRTDAQQGLQVAEDTLKKMQEIAEANRIETEHIQNLGRQSGEIARIMDVIDTIADQTKLIAFNASLEAAGAGTSGKRFSIVAQEIRHLADSVFGSTKSIRQTLANIQSSVQSLIASSEKSTTSIHEGGEFTGLTTEWLKEILKGTAKTTNAAQKISRSILGQQRASEEISTALKEISTNIDQFAHLSATTCDIASRIDMLSKELDEVLKVFKL